MLMYDRVGMVYANEGAEVFECCLSCSQGLRCDRRGERAKKMLLVRIIALIDLFWCSRLGKHEFERANSSI
jgi:hypothetical protein